MAFSRTRQSGLPYYRVDEVVLDTPDDLLYLSGTKYHPGSIARIISNGAIYKLNHQHQWVKQFSSSSGGDDVAISIATVYVDDNNHLIVVLTDGTVQDAGEIKVTASAVDETKIISF